MLKQQGDLRCRNGMALIGVETAWEISGVEMAGRS